MVGKIISGLDDDSPLNPGVIADNVGDNIGGLAGTCSDLFSSLSESLCGVLILCSTSSEVVKNSNSFYFHPFMIIAVGIMVCIIVSIASLTLLKPNNPTGLDRNLRW